MEAEAEGTLKRRRRRLHRAYVFQNGFVALVAFLFLVSSVAFWLDPVNIQGSIGHLPPYDYYWNGAYLSGSVMVLVGLFGRRIGVEAAGHILLVPGLALQFLVAIPLLGLHRITLLTFVFAVGAGMRAYGLVMGWSEAHHD